MSIKNTINNYSYNTNIIVTDFQQSIQACQTEHSYFKNTISK